MLTASLNHSLSACFRTANFAVPAVLLAAVALASVPAQAQQFPDCSSASADADGDGWGWENNRSCVVVEDRSSSASSSSGTPAVTVPGLSFPVCRSSASDPDNDGYGYEDGESCIVQSGITESQSNTQPQSDNQSQTVNLPDCSSAASDPDGDGYGWENNNSCIVTSGSTIQSDDTSTQNSGVPQVQAAKAGAFTIDNVTDVVLVTGQSNVLAANTGYNSGLDRPDSQVFAYTNNGWQVADLHQSWDRFQHPAAQSRNGGDPVNNFALHFGKYLVQKDRTRVVAFIVVPGPGKGISNWDAGTEQYRRIQDKVTRALNNIPQKNSLDAVLWHQGENDWLYEGTADANPTGFTSRDSHEYKNYYQIKLTALINNFRNEPWGNSQTAFICGETRRAEGVNRRLNALNHDRDPNTACVQATDLPKRADDPYGSHFSAAGLRTLGQRYADKYFEISSR